MEHTPIENSPKRAGSVRRALFWASLGQAAFFALQFLSSVVLARLLDPREMGVFAIGAATVGLVSALQALGLNNLLIRAERIDQPLLSTVFTVNLILSFLVSLAVIGLGLFSAFLFDEPGTIQVMLWLSVTPLLTALGLLPSSLIQRENNFRALSLLKIFSTLMGTALTIALALFGSSYMSLAYGWLLTCAANCFGAWILAPHHVHLRLGVRRWREVLKFGSGMIVVNGVTQAQRQVLNLILGRFQGLEAVGLYTRANSLSSLLIENTQTVAMRVFLVDFAEAARNGLDLRSRYLKVIELMTATLWPVFAGLAVLSAPAVKLLYGPTWHALALPLSLLCVSGLFWIAVAMAWELFVVANETTRQAVLETQRSAVGTILFTIGCQFNLVIAVASRIAETFYSVFLYRPHIARITGCTSRDFFSVYLRSAGLTIAAICPAAILMQRYDWSADTPLMLVAGSMAAGIALWLLCLFVMKHPLLLQFVSLIKRPSTRLNESAL